MNKAVLIASLSLLLIAAAHAEPVPPATNKDGSPVSGFVQPGFNLAPSEGEDPEFPLPFNLLFDASDFTISVPDDVIEDPQDFSDPLVALGELDGFSTTERWTINMNAFPNRVDPATVIPGQTIRFFEVSTVFGTVVIVNGIVRELTPGVDYIALMATEDVLAIVPLKPLKEMSTYMAVLTNDITDTAGNNATPSQFYHFTKAQTPWVDETGQSTSPFFDDATAALLEGLRRITASMESVAESAGIPKEDIVVSWTAQTQAVTPVLKNLRSIARPAATEIRKTPFNTSILGTPGLADIYIGVITLPYYLGVPSASMPTAPLTEFWRAAPGAYVPPFDAFGLDPGSTTVTVANPFPVKTDDQTVPLLLTAPNSKTGLEKPPAGWPVVIFGHALGSNRTNLLAVADTMAAAGYAVIGIDSPLHGISPDDPALRSLYVGNTPWAGVANERTFDVDYIDNATLAPGPDGIVDPSGIHVINLRSLLTTRDNARQAQADLSVLAVTLPLIDIDGDALPDLDASNVSFAGIAMGSIVGTVFATVEPLVPNAFLSAPAGGLARAFEASEVFGPAIRAGLAGAGVEPGTSNYELFFTAFQTIIDSADPINWIGEAARFNNVLVHEIIGDTFLPNFISTAPLSGTEPLIAAGGLAAYSSTISVPAGVRAAGRFVPPASHISLLSPESSPAATAEMQRQMASFIVSRGTAVAVEDASTMAPAPAPASDQSLD